MAGSHTTAATSPPVIGTGDRFTFALIMALAIHGLVLFGVGFGLAKPQHTDAPMVLQVALAQFTSDKKPEKADFIGQANQEGGGNLDHAERLTTPEQAVIEDASRQVSAPAAAPPTTTAQPKSLITSTSSDTRTRGSITLSEETRTSKPAPRSAELVSQAMQVAALMAELDRQRQAEAKRPRKRQVSAAIHESYDALYLDSWRRKIERIGNLNYPEKARELGLYGDLVLSVAINKDGTLNEIDIITSSGDQLLDDAAVRIVKLAAPFAPLTPKMMEETDVLDIVRVWRFQPNDGFSAN